MRILVTGASGNIGTALLRRLAGRHELLGVSRRKPPAVAPYDAVEWHQVDLAAPSAADALRATMQGCDAVVHLAWAIQPGRDRERLRRVNQGGTAAVIDAARGAGVAHLLCVSSIGAYSAGQGQWVDESWPTDGIATSSYSVDKAAVERMLDDAEGGECTITRVRPGIVLHEAAAAEVARYFLGPLAPLSVLGRPGLIRFAPLPRELGIQVVHADDLADALALLLDGRHAGAFNVADEPVLDRDSLRESFGGMGPPMPPRVIRALMAGAYAARLQPCEPGWFDLAMSVPRMRTDRLRALGWKPGHTAVGALRAFLPAFSAGRGMTGPVLYPRGQREPAAPPG